jgi:hypothetical protein
VHTIKVIAAGFVLLALCLLAGRAFGTTPPAGLALGAKIFLPLWFLGAGINLWIGVSRAGYTFAEEAPVFLVVFGVPALIALAVWWRFSQAVT